MTRKKRLLIIEDEEPILMGLVKEFSCQGYDVDFSWDGEEGLKKALKGEHDLIILDIMLPSKDGFAICQEIKEIKREQPIIVLSAKGETEDVICGLRLGADDYVAKPFSLAELAVRVECVLRRAGVVRNPCSRITIAGEFAVDTVNLVGCSLRSDSEASRKGAQVEFTRKEVEVLEFLLCNEHRPVPRAELLHEVWGYPKASRIQTRTVDIHIAKLRRKIERNPKLPKHIITVHGEGYRLLGAKRENPSKKAA